METNSIGERISKLRANSGLTQKELGDKLNVTAQAVSKWENGLSEPDIDTLKKLSVIFGISVSELIDGETSKETATAQATVEEDTTPASTTEPAPTASPVTEKVVTRIINGYCESCKKPVGPGEYVVESGRGWQRIYCNECKKKREETAKSAAVYTHSKETQRSIIFGSIGGIVALAISLIFLLNVDSAFPVGAAIVISIIFGLAYFTFIGQMFWDGVINDMFFFFLKSFRMPGVIFTLDLEGILFLIFVKLGLAFLSIFLSIFWFLIGVIIFLPVASLIVYPFALTKHIVTGKKLKAEADKSKAQKAK